VLYALFITSSLFLISIQNKINVITIKEKISALDYRLKGDLIPKHNIAEIKKLKKELKPTLRNEETQEKTVNFLNFHRNHNKFMDTLSSCIMDDQCHIFYHHVQKTGGTTLENRIFGAFPFHKKRTKHRTCCGRKVMKDYDRYQKYYCQAKFTSYQVSASQFETVVSTCMHLNLKNNTSSRAVALVSIRDPETRTLSNIHQICNKNSHKRSKDIVEACSSCAYEKHSKVFDKFVQQTNKDYEEAFKSTRLMIPNVSVMLFDTEDMEILLGMLLKKLPNHFSFSLNKKINQEEVTRCDFGMKSNMFKELAPARKIYRNLTSE